MGNSMSGSFETEIRLRYPSKSQNENCWGAVVITDKRMERAEHKAFVASEIAKLQPVIDAAGKFAD